MSNFGISVVVHDRGYRQADKRDITGNVTSLTIDSGVEGPWGRAMLRLLFPKQDGVSEADPFSVSSPKVPAPGDWVVVSAAAAFKRGDAAPKAIFFGVVQSVSGGGHVRGSAVDHGEVAVTCISWFDYVNKNQVITTLVSEKSVGTLLSVPRERTKLSESELDTAKLKAIPAWFQIPPSQRPPLEDFVYQVLDGKAPRSFTDFVETLVGTVSPENNLYGLGDAVAKTWQFVAEPTVPATLAVDQKGNPARTGDVVPVVASPGDALRYDLGMPAPAVPGWTLSGLSAIAGSSATTGSLMAMFMADRELVEMFPAIVPDDEATHGARPVLVYRLRPFQFVTLSEWADVNRRFSELTQKDKDLADALFPDRTALVSRAQTRPTADETIRYEGRLAADDVFRPKPPEPSPADGDVEHDYVTLTPDDVVSGDVSWSEDRHFNCVTMDLMGQSSPIKWLGEAGLPFVSESSVTTYGLRAYSADWPFLPDLDAEDGGDVLGFMRVIAALAAQAVAGMDRFGSGSASLAGPHPYIKPGMWVRLPIPRVSDQMGDIYAYVMRVSHSVAVGPDGAITASTQIVFERAVFARNLDFIVQNAFDYRPAKAQEQAEREAQVGGHPSGKIGEEA